MLQHWRNIYWLLYQENESGFIIQNLHAITWHTANKWCMHIILFLKIITMTDQLVHLVKFSVSLLNNMCLSWYLHMDLIYLEQRYGNKIYNLYTIIQKYRIFCIGLKLIQVHLLGVSKKVWCSILTLTLFRYLLFLAYRSHLKLTPSKVAGGPPPPTPGIDPGTPRTPISWPRACDAARPAIPYV